MTQGEVGFERLATVPIFLRGRDGAPGITLSAVIDTGFDGFLSLPPETIAALRLEYFGKQKQSVFGGGEILCDVYLLAVQFAGEGRGITVLSSETPPLIGMRLLYGTELRIDVVDGGKVTVTPHPSGTPGEAL